MVSVLLIWIYIFITTFFTGACFLCAVFGKERMKIQHRLLDPEDFCLCGIMLATVYAQIFSLFSNVGLAANIVLILITAACAYFLFKSRIHFFEKPGPLLCTILIVLAVIMSYGCSRGYFHYDSDLYHGQSIRWIEEYGVVKGLALLHMRLGYNSSSFALSALYSFSFLNGQSFHAVQGYIALLLLIKCLRVFHVFKDRKIHMSDVARIGGFYYLFNIYDEMVAPASDYFAMATFIFCIIKCVDIYEQCTSDTSLYTEESYVFPALLSVYIPTVKLSAAPAVLIVLIPVVMLIKSKKWWRIGLYAVISLIIAVPLFIRNYILSGRLFYPSTALDLFDPAWKIPASAAALDSAYIVGFGRGYNFAEAAEYPFSQWFPHWFASLGRSDLLIFVVCLVSVLILPLSIILRKGFKTIHVIEITAISAFLFWLVSAPLVRYGMGFLLLLPPLMSGDLAAFIIEKSPKEKSAGKLIRVCFPVILLAFLGFKCFATLKYIAGSISAPYYLVQRDYNDYDCIAVNIDGIDVYVPTEGDQTGYYLFPSTPELSDDLHLSGDSLKDGFVLR